MEQPPQQQPEAAAAVAVAVPAAAAAPEQANQNGSAPPPPPAALPPAFVQDPAAFLASIVSQPPSRSALAQLAGPVAKKLAEETPEGVAPLYLQAAAVQLRTLDVARDVEQEVQAVQHQYEILEVRNFL